MKERRGKEQMHGRGIEGDMGRQREGNEGKRKEEVNGKQRKKQLFPNITPVPCASFRAQDKEERGTSTRM